MSFAVAVTLYAAIGETIIDSSFYTTTLEVRVCFPEEAAMGRCSEYIYVNPTVVVRENSPHTVKRHNSRSVKL